MPKIKSILKKLEVEAAKGKRTCKNSRAAILKGQKCLVVYDGVYEKHPYCREIALAMIAEARKKLDDLEELVTT